MANEFDAVAASVRLRTLSATWLKRFSAVIAHHGYLVARAKTVLQGAEPQSGPGHSLQHGKSYGRHCNFHRVCIEFFVSEAERPVISVTTGTPLLL
jgi:hypothetical protein